MQIVLVGTDLAPVRPGAGALETLVAGWATGLAAAHDVTVASVAGAPAPSVSPPVPYAVRIFRHPSELSALIGDIGPDAVLLNNRPAWQHWVPAPTVHLFHNWPDAWDLPDGVEPADVVGRAGAAAVSRSLAATVASTLGRRPCDVGVVSPFVPDALFAVVPRPEPGLVLSPNRLMVKKGVRELAAIAGHPAMRDCRVMITDYLSPWTSPTAEHQALRALVDASAAELIAPPADLAAMADLYARADVVVCPSVRPEGLGLTALEAQAVGIPVVSSGLGGLREATLRPDLIADPTDAASFSRAIHHAAGLDAGERRRLREEIRSRYARAASLDALLAALERAEPPGYELAPAAPLIEGRRVR